jgi:hypothetical protein
MFPNYEIDFGKLNLNWLHGLSIVFEEIADLIQVSERAQMYLQEQGTIEVIGYTNQRKFITVLFTLTDQKIIVEDVNLPRYETIQDVILRRLAEETE